MKKLPDTNRAARKLLHTLAAAPGTFYQICERAEYNIDDDAVERMIRPLFDDLVDDGHAAYDGLVYSITNAARAAIAPAVPRGGQVAGPAFRGSAGHTGVKIARRTAGARA